MSHLWATLCYEICIIDLKSAAVVGTVVCCFFFFPLDPEHRLHFRVSQSQAKAVNWLLVSGMGSPMDLAIMLHACSLAICCCRFWYFNTTGLVCSVSSGRTSDRDLVTCLSSFGGEKKPKPDVCLDSS